MRAALDAEESTEVLHRRLSALDSVAASRTEPTNRRRIVRALEVTIGADRPFSSFGPGLEEYPETDHLIIGLDVARDRLGGLVGDRVEQMMADGFLDEVTVLAARPAGISRTAAQALGYRELLAHLAGEASLDDAVADTVRRTRQFAVRQDRWFRRDPRTLWFDFETRSLPQRIADTLEQR